MRNKRTAELLDQERQAQDMSLFHAGGSTPEGALVTGETADDGRIAVVYNSGDTPPEITIAGTSKTVQIIMANGVAVAVVARAHGPRLTRKDVLLVERFVA